METEHIQQLLFFFLLIKPISGADDDCRPASCGPSEPEIRFPFRITGRQPSKCGFPGFDLACNSRNQTIIQLPSSRSYTVNQIEYDLQGIHIDPGFCRPNQISDFLLTDTPFDFVEDRDMYSFYNCSLRNYNFMEPAVPIRCLSGDNYTVIAVPMGFFPIPLSCRFMKTIWVAGIWNVGVRVELMFLWFTPDCRSCEREGRLCGFNTQDGQTYCHASSSHRTRISNSVKYGFSLGVGLLVSACIIGLVYYMAYRMRTSSVTQHQSIDLFPIAVFRQSPSTTGLDGPTIESYPRTVLGESCRLPNDTSTCAICLSEFKSKESLRTIPECNHYFHVECIDVWLKINATCPVCRNSLENPSLVTP